MTAIEVTFLTGRYVATAHDARDETEWPPHPARLYSAMVAAWADSDQAERSALEWLETQPPPNITASEADERRVVRHFVPVNDKISSGKDLNKVSEVLPKGRVKKPRYFPSVTPRDPIVTYAWPQKAPIEVSEVLDSLLERVTRLGHSSSLVSCRRLQSRPPAANYVPDDDSRMLRLRWVKKGQLRELKQLYERHQAMRSRDLPFVTASYRLPYRMVAYRDVETGADGTVAALARPNTAGKWIVFEVHPADRRMPLTHTVELTKALRSAVFSYADDPIPEGLSGHLLNGRPSAKPHVGFIALPNVGHEHADGRVMGFAVSLPHELDSEARQATLRAIGTWENQAGSDWRLVLRLGKRGTCRMRRRQGPFALVSLRPSIWCRCARTWVSVTPVALPRHPGRLSSGTAHARARAWARAEAAVLRALEHVGLPAPDDVTVSLAPFVIGSRPAAHFPVFRQGGGQQRGTIRCLVHICVRFSEHVTGPLILGSGRYLGLGLMRPVFDSLVEPGSGSPKGGGNA